MPSLMKFSQLALTGWSYCKGDKEIEIDSLDLSTVIKSRNPAKSTFVYSDEDIWKSCVQNHSKASAKMGNVSDDKVDAFFGVHNGFNKHPTPAAPEVQDAFPNSSGYVMEFSLGCASVILGAQLAGFHMFDENIRNIAIGLVQLNTQYSVNYSDGNCILADSFGALMFSKRSSGNLIKYTGVNSNSYFNDMFVLNKEGMYSLTAKSKGKKLTKFMANSFGQQLRKSCLAFKIFPKDIDYIAISCSTYSATKLLLDQMGFPLEKTGIKCLTQIPHMGTNDLLFQLDYGVEQGLIKPGAKVIVAGTSLGFSMASMAIEWGQ